MMHIFLLDKFYLLLLNHGDQNLSFKQKKECTIFFFCQASFYFPSLIQLIIDYFVITERTTMIAIDTKRKIFFFTTFSSFYIQLQTLSDLIVLIVRQMMVLVWQMTVNLWTEVVHSSWQIIHQKWKIVLHLPCDSHHPFPMKWPIEECNNTTMHKRD